MSLLIQLAAFKFANWVLKGQICQIIWLQIISTHEIYSLYLLNVESIYAMKWHVKQYNLIQQQHH